MESLSQKEIVDKSSLVICKRLKIEEKDKIDSKTIFSESQVLCVIYDIELEFDITIDESQISGNKLSACNYTSILDIVEKLVLMNLHSCPRQDAQD